MQPVTIIRIVERLEHLSTRQLATVYDFVSYLAERDGEDGLIEARQTMLASEAVLSLDWDKPEEDAAWADL